MIGFRSLARVLAALQKVIFLAKGVNTEQVCVCTWWVSLIFSIVLHTNQSGRTKVTGAIRLRLAKNGRRASSSTG